MYKIHIIKVIYILNQKKKPMMTKMQIQDFRIKSFTFGPNIPFETTSNTNLLDAVFETFQHFSNWN